MFESGLGLLLIGCLHESKMATIDEISTIDTLTNGNPGIWTCSVREYE